MPVVLAFERLGRLKLNGQLRGYSDLSRLHHADCARGRGDVVLDAGAAAAARAAARGRIAGTRRRVPISRTRLGSSLFAFVRSP